MMKRIHHTDFMFAILMTLVLFSCLFSRAEDRPNIVLIMADDMGFSDIGCFGAEIETPNLDRLAVSGMRCTQFYNMAKCNPTRSTLFTGLFLPKNNTGNAIPFSTLLGEAGYYTAMAGKEHFDKWVPGQCYAINAFNDSFCFWVNNPFFIPPDGRFQNDFKLNGETIDPKDMPVEDPPFYKTDVITTYALGFLDKAKESKQPFLLYLPYHVAHFPLQAREEEIAKYRGKYRWGWDRVRQARFEKQKELGIVPRDWALSPPEDNINQFRGPYRGNIYKYRSWCDVPKQEQEELDLEMAVFAAMVDRLDQNIGRVLEKLERMDALDNTLILFFSDNGGCPYDGNKDLNIPPGGPASYRTLCAAWANVGNTPFRFYKQYGHEGGCRSHFIAHWPNRIKPGEICDAPAHVSDIYPTLLELAGITYPDRTTLGVMPKLDGTSMLPLFEGKRREEPPIMLSGFSDRFPMVRFGDWKLVKVNKGPWELYNIKNDPTEQNNLAGLMPEKLRELDTRFQQWLDENGAVLKRK